MSAKKNDAKRARAAIERKNLRVVQAMARASLDPLPASGWLRLARLKSGGELKAALAAVGIELDSAAPAKNFGFFCKRVRDIEFRDAEGGGPYVLRSRYNNGDSAYWHGIAHPQRAALVAARDKRVATREQIDVTAAEIARRLVRGDSLDGVMAETAKLPNSTAPSNAADLVQQIAPKPITAQQFVAQLTHREAGHFSPLGTPTPPPAREPATPVIVETHAARVPVDSSSLPGAWRTRGRQDYSPKTREEPANWFVGQRRPEMSGSSPEHGPNFAAIVNPFAELDLANNYPRSPLPK